MAGYRPFSYQLICLLQETIQGGADQVNIGVLIECIGGQIVNFNGVLQAFVPDHEDVEHIVIQLVQDLFLVSEIHRGGRRAHVHGGNAPASGWR